MIELKKFTEIRLIIFLHLLVHNRLEKYIYIIITIRSADEPYFGQPKTQNTHA